MLLSIFNSIFSTRNVPLPPRSHHIQFGIKSKKCKLKPNLKRQEMLCKKRNKWDVVILNAKVHHMPDHFLSLCIHELQHQLQLLWQHLPWPVYRMSYRYIIDTTKLRQKKMTWKVLKISYLKAILNSTKNRENCSRKSKCIYQEVQKKNIFICFSCASSKQQRQWIKETNNITWDWEITLAITGRAIEVPNKYFLS